MSYFTFIPSIVWLVISSVFFACGEFLSKKFAFHQILRAHDRLTF